MSQQSHNTFEEQWRDAFDDASLIPSESVWDAIEATLDASLPPTPEKPSGGMGTWHYVLSGAIAGAALLSWWLYTRTEVTPVPAVVHTPSIRHEKLTTIPTQTLVSAPQKYQLNPSKPFIKARPALSKTEVLPLPALQVEKNVIDSLDFLQPLKTQSLPVTTTLQEVQASSIAEPVIPYYEKKPPVAQPNKKKNPLKNLRISVGAGVYQR